MKHWGCQGVLRGWNRLLQGDATAAQHVSQHSEDPETPFSFFACEVCVCTERSREINLATQLCINLEYKGKNPGARRERLSVPPPAFVSPLGLRLSHCTPEPLQCSGELATVTTSSQQLPRMPRNTLEQDMARWQPEKVLYQGGQPLSILYC